MKEIKICRGLPGSGKTTWAKQYVKDHPDFVRISRDDFRRMRGEYWIPEQEKLITEWENACIDKALKSGYNVIIDATNLKPAYIKKFFDKYLPGNIITLQDFFTVPLSVCIERDKIRTDTVGADVINNMYQKYLGKSLDVSSKQFISELYDIQEKESYVQNPNLPPIVICDLDGTLAIHNGRGTYEYHKCDTDLINDPVKIILDNLPKEYKIVFASGREDSCKEKTMAWLQSHGFYSYELHMRKTGDFRKDSIIKKEIYDQNIKNKYYVQFVLDDRDQVVELWRSLGLTCLQVAEGNF